MNEADAHSSFRASQRQQPPPNPPPSTTLPSIPQLPPISFASSPSVESFTTALSSTSTHSRPSAVENVSTSAGTTSAFPSLTFTPPASPLQVRPASSVQHLKSAPDSRWQADFSDLSDYEGGHVHGRNFDRAISSDERNRATPIPSHYRRTPNYASDASRRYESERDEAYHSTASTSRGGTMSDSHAAVPTFSRSLSSKPSSSAIASRLHALTTTSNHSITSASSSFVGNSVRTATVSTSRRDGTTISPAGSQLTSGKPLPNPIAGPSTSNRSVGRARSASLLGMVSSAAIAGPSREPPREHQLPRSTSSSTIQAAQKPRLTLRPAVPPPSDPPADPAPPAFTILVVGTPQCGKSILISKGLRAFGLEGENSLVLGTYETTVQLPAAIAASMAKHSSPSSSSSNGTATRTVTHEIRAISRIAHVPIRTSIHPIEVLEVGSQELFLAGNAWPAVIANGRWTSGQTSVAAGVKTGVAAAAGRAAPQNASHPRGRVIDGLVVAYDSSETESWQVARSLLEQASQAYTNQPISAIVVACKTDLLDPPVPSDHTEYHPLLSGHSSEADQFQIGTPETPAPTHNRGHQRNSSDGSSTQRGGANMVHKNLGLVPVARTEGTGRKKMRDLFTWLLRQMEREKRHYRANLAAARAAAAGQSQPPSLVSSSTAGASTSTPIPPSSTLSPVDSASSFRPAAVPNSNHATSHNGNTPSGSPSTTSPVAGPGSAPISPLSALSPSSSMGQNPLSLSLGAQAMQPSASASGTRSPRSPASPTRARSTSDLASDYSKGNNERKEERDREFVKMGLAAKASAAGAGAGYGSGTERSVASLSGKKGTASVANLRGRADSVGASLSVAPPGLPANGVGMPGGSLGRSSVNGSVKAALVDNSTSASGSHAGDSPEDGRASGPSAGPESRPAGPAVSASMLPMKAAKEPPPLQYATFDELLDKLVFLTVTDDDPIYIEQFLLVYRRFATPRSLLLGLQRRMRELSSSAEDMLLAKFAQMRICALLEEWMKTYPGDFAAPGAEPALQALIRQVLSNLHTAHYGSDFAPFLGIIPDLRDEEASWALKEPQRPVSHDDGPSDLEPDGPEAEAVRMAKMASHSSSIGVSSTDSSLLHGDRLQPSSNQSPHSAPMNGSRSHASSKASTKTAPHIPLFGDYHPSKGLRGPDVPPGTKANLKELLKASTTLIHQLPHHVAEEITRLEVPLFLSVQPRDWLRHGLGQKGSEGFPDSLQRMAKFYNYLAMWTASFILVHDKPRARAKAIEFFIRVAMVLRKLNNYSGLRAVVTGISTSRTDRDNDPVMAYIRDRHLWKKEFRSLETLLGTSRMHSAYRMALKHTFDAAIPSMEVHTYDLIRADDTNPDYKPGDDTQIHWGKFSLIAKMILNVVMYQDRFMDTTAFTFPERSDIRELIMNVIIMDDDTVYARVSLPADSHSSGPLSDTGGSTSRFRQIFTRR